MAAFPRSSAASVEEYRNTSYPDGGREYLDGLVVERNVGTPGHSALQKILIVEILSPDDRMGFDVPERGFLPFDSGNLLARLDAE
jgi:hypothetical protein